jgi:micrococcal nuclease
MGLFRFFVRALLGAPQRRSSWNGQPRTRRATWKQEWSTEPTAYSSLHDQQIAYRPAPSVSPPKQQFYVISGKCWVIDGDTIDIDGNRIRLAGIDAPEMDHPYGNSAKRLLIKLCKGQIIRAVFENDSTYGRSVATCYLPDGRDLSAEMVKAGMAIDWRKFSGGKYRAMETPDARKKLWRCDARQKGRMPPVIPD